MAQSKNNTSNCQLKMRIIKQIILVLTSLVSLNSWSYVCQPTDAGGHEGYDSERMYDDYYLYNASIYNSHQIVFDHHIRQKEYWCLYTSKSNRDTHLNSCRYLDDIKYPICTINIGGLVNDGRFKNTTIYQDPIDSNTCSVTSVCLTIPQTLSISNETNNFDVNTQNSTGVFLIESNGWVDFNFTGTSIDENGGKTNAPKFYKAEVDAKGVQIPNRYDQLDTAIGVRVEDAELLKQITSSTASFNSWKLNSDHYGVGSNQPSGSPADFILPMTDPLSPGFAIGSFSPKESLKAKVSVYATATGYYGEQSGKYEMDIVLTVTAREN